MVVGKGGRGSRRAMDGGTRRLRLTRWCEKGQPRLPHCLAGALICIKLAVAGAPAQCERSRSRRVFASPREPYAGRPSPRSVDAAPDLALGGVEHGGHHQQEQDHLEAHALAARELGLGGPNGGGGLEPRAIGSLAVSGKGTVLSDQAWIREGSNENHVQVASGSSR